LGLGFESIPKAPNPNLNPEAQRNQIPNTNPKTQKYLGFKKNLKNTFIKISLCKSDVSARHMHPKILKGSSFQFFEYLSFEFEFFANLLQISKKII